jgi:pimeloyl-ACP methyl ester carboxylesterase
MKNIFIFILIFPILQCWSQESTSSINEKIYIILGGEKQYVEINGKSEENPILLFLHGGPGWPQTPHIRYFNSDLFKKITVVSWDQSGCGKSYMMNPNPKNLSEESLMKDAHELTLYLKKKFNKNKIYLLGFSYGSVIGLQLANLYPEDYFAYIGVSQLIDYQANWDSSMDWLKKQAELRNDIESLNKINQINEKDSTFCKNISECFLEKYKLLVKYNGAIYNNEILNEIDKAEHYYEDYKNYDWYKSYNYSTSRIGDKRFFTNLTYLNSFKIPIIFMAGRHDWNLPGIVTEKYFKKISAPQKSFFWFEKSGHEPPEEEAKKFNKLIKKIIKRCEYVTAS